MSKQHSSIQHQVARNLQCGRTLTAEKVADYNLSVTIARRELSVWGWELGW